MAKFLDKILASDAVSDLLGKKRSALGIDIGSSAVKIVQLGEKDGKAVLENYGELALGPYAKLNVGQAANLSKTKIKEALLDLFKEAGVSNVRRSAFSIPMGSTLLSLIEVPKVDRKKLDSMIPIEARKYIPVPVSEVVLDWWALPEPDTAPGDPRRDTMEVLIAAIHNDMVAKYMEIKEGVNLGGGSFEIDIFSSIRSVVGRDNSALMVLDMGAGTTKLAIVEEGILRMQHIINMGSQDITVTLAKMMDTTVPAAEKLKREEGLLEPSGKVKEAASLPLNHIFTEVNKVVANYRKKNKHQITKVILTGGGVLLKGFEKYAAGQLDVDVAVGAPFSRIETPIFLGDTLQEAGPEFAVAIGLAIKALQE
jgi:type IV pilus assembly protein PilM